MPVVTAASNGPEGCSSTICTSLTNVYSTNDDDAAMMAMMGVTGFGSTKVM